ncbi:SEC-C metal-binding domain-containing protein [Sphingomonas sp. AOB5]|uniref:SEC-C metal-binding domain-containing protein n=1 Tax=Sphingomonas sp. AOB5 TaxID=3034017 RepID=UPI0023F8CDD0|nr:SEC-C metal-binding domain-containing protein [Sphingomonas sp. AOB5]MDF7774261.1 SEC-C metal-binding domain-containing protein [Sphingomonas sp. AOB5]
MRFETARTEQEVFDDLERLCASPGYIHVLALLSFRDNLVLHSGELTSEALAASYAPQRTIRTEFSTLLGLMLKHPIDFDLPSPTEMQRLIDCTGELLEELHACFNMPMMAALKRAFEEVQAGLTIEEASPFLRGDVLREPIFYGGESAYSFQYRDFAVKRYARDDDWLFANKGFRIAEGRAVAEALTTLPNDKLLAVLDKACDADPTTLSFLPGFTFSLDEVAAAASVSSKSAAAVLAAFTAPEAPSNADFRTIGDFNLANAYPILRTPSDDYVSLQSYGVVEALYDSPYYWMAADKGYRNTAFQHRGDFTESFVADRLAAVFGEANVHRGVNVIRKGARVSEIDVLVLFANRAIVVQCKSKKLTLEARRGNDLQLQDDFKKAVQDAYDQAHLCATSLSDPTLRFVGSGDVAIDISELREIYPVCVVSDHYPALGAQARQFLRFQTDAIIQAPLIGDVFLIDVLAEMLPSPLRLLSYVNRRVGYGDRINTINELTILAYHLKHNLWFEDEMNLVTIADDFSISLDTAMTVRRTGIAGEHTPDGILTRLKGTLVGRVLANIETRPDAALVDLGFLLLSLGGETIDDLNRGLQQISEQTRRDGRSHNLTLGFDDSQSGLTIHCGPLPNAEAAEKLADHCRRRKYVHRAEGWFGLAVRADDGLPKFGIQLSYPWKHDSALERLTRGMTRKSPARPAAARTTAPGVKVGRNELCPCGSGKKFKKCCLT